MYAELGLHDEAAAEIDVLVADRLAAVPRDALFHGSLSYLADACCAVGDRDGAAARLRRADRLARPRRPGRATCSPPHGAVDRYLGKLAALLGADREAEIHFAAALAHRRGGRHAGVARPQPARRTAGSLAARSRQADVARAVTRCGAGAGDRRAAAAWPHGRRGGAVGARASSAGEAPTAARQSAGLTEREVAVLGARRRGPQQPRDRRPPAHQPAHRGQPHPVDPDEDGSAPTAPRPRPGRCGDEPGDGVSDRRPRAAPPGRN